MKELYHFLKEKDDIASILDGVSSGIQEQLIAGLSGIARSMFVSAVHYTENRKKVIVTHQLIHAQSLYDDMIELSDNPNVYLYPVNEMIAAEMAVASPELRTTRIRSLTKWLASEDGILIVPIAALK